MKGRWKKGGGERKAVEEGGIREIFTVEWGGGEVGFFGGEIGLCMRKTKRKNT